MTDASEAPGPVETTVVIELDQSQLALLRRLKAERDQADRSDAEVAIDLAREYLARPATPD